MADSTQFTIDIDVPVQSTEQAADALMKLSTQLEASGKAASNAAKAVTEGEASYKRAEAAAASAAKAVEAIGLKSAAAAEKLAKIGEGVNGVVNVGAYRRAQAAVDALNARQEKAAGIAASTAAALATEAASLDTLKGTAAAAADQQSRLVKAEQAGLATMKALEAAEKARAAAIAKTTEAQAKAAAEQAKNVAAARADAQAKQALALRTAAGSAKANEAAEAFAKLGGPLGALGGKAFGAADGMKKLVGSLGSAGPYIAVALAIAAIAAGVVALGAAAVSATASILKFAVSNADAARTAALLAEEAKGGAAGLAATAKLALSLDSQAKKLKDSIGKIFSVGAGPLERFLAGAAKLVELFEENSATANAMKVVFQSLFDPILDGITSLIPTMVSAFIQFEILALKAMIAIKPYGSVIVGIAKVVGGLALLLAGVFTSALVGVGIMLASVAGVIAFVVAVLGAFVAATVYGISVVLQFGEAIHNGIGAALEWLGSLSLTQMGTDLIMGLVNGITGAGGAVLGAVKGVATGAIDAAKKALGIASPSKVFAEIGGYTAEGMQVGVEEGSADVQGALTSLVDPPAPGAGGSTTNASTTTSNGGDTFHIYLPAGSSKSLAEEIRDKIRDLRTQTGRGAPSAA